MLSYYHPFKVIMATKVRAVISHSPLSKHVHSALSALVQKEAQDVDIALACASGNMGGNSNTINSPCDLG